MKIVALDVGSKRIGVAMADTGVRIAVPYGVIEVDGTEFEQIAKIMGDEKTNRLVVGLPRNGNGEETAQSVAVREFVVALQDYFGQRKCTVCHSASGVCKHKLERLLVKFQDESLTSVLAEENLAQGKRNKRRGKGEVDREAATLILQDFLDSFRLEAEGDSNDGGVGGGVGVGGRAVEVSEEKKVGDMWKANDGKKKSKRLGKVLRVLATVVVLLVVAVVGAMAWYADALKAVDVSNCQGAICGLEEFVILEGEPVEVVADKLAEKKLIRDAWAMRIYLKLERKEKDIKSGVYVLSNNMSVAEIVEEFGKGSEARAFLLEIAAGEKIELVKRRLVDVGYEASEVDAAFRKSYRHKYWGETDMTVDGFMYAGDYRVGVGMGAEGVLELVLARLAVVSEENKFKDQYAAIGFTFAEGFAWAGKVRREVGEVSEFARAETAKAYEMLSAVMQNSVDVSPIQYYAAINEVNDVAVDMYALAGVAYSWSKVPFVAAGDYEGWKMAYGDIARRVGTEKGIPYEAILAQSILESSWGKSRLAYRYFNFFGIKYANMPQDSGVAPMGSVNMQTWEEYEPGVSTTVNADFAVWDDLEKGFRAYAAWIKAQSRYAGALAYPDDPVRYIEELKRAGYATDNNYVKTLASIIDSLRES